MYRSWILFCALVFLPLPGFAADVIGLALPLEGPFAPVTRRMETGAAMAVKQLVSQGYDIELKPVAGGCDEKMAAETAATVKVLRQSGAKIVVGPVCFKQASALAQALNSDENDTVKIPVIAYDTRNPLLKRKREFDHLPLFSLSVAPDAESKAVVDFILPQFANRPFALLDDGSVYGRSLSDSIRLIGEQAGYRPVISANFRPLQTKQTAVLRRLEQSGAEAVFIAAAPEDVVTIARDMARLNYDWITATGESGQLLPYTDGAETIAPGLLMVKPAEPDRSRFNTLLANDKNQSDEKKKPDASLLAGYALVQIAAKAIGQNGVNLTGQSFNTVLGPLVFDADGRAAPASFALFRWDGAKFIRDRDPTQ